MTTFPTRREQRKHETARDYRVSSVIDVAGMSPELQRRFAEQLEEAIYTAGPDYPAVTHYLFEYNFDADELEVGLQIENVVPDEVEGIADALLQNVLETAAQSVELDTLPTSEESELYLV